MASDTKTEFKSSGISEEKIRARRKRRVQLESSEVTTMVTNANPELINPDNDPDNNKLKVYRDAVIDAIVSAEMPAETEKDIETRFGEPYYPLEIRWESWFRKAHFNDPKDWVKKVKRDRDHYLENSH